MQVWLVKFDSNGVTQEYFTSRKKAEAYLALWMQVEGYTVSNQDKLSNITLTYYNETHAYSRVEKIHVV